MFKWWMLSFNIAVAVDYMLCYGAGGDIYCGGACGDA